MIMFNYNNKFIKRFQLITKIATLLIL